MENEKLEKNLIEAVDLRGAGKTDAEILALYPESRAEIKEIFDVIDKIAKEKADIIAPRDVLYNIINSREFALEGKAVTIQEQNRLKYQEEKTGRSSSILNFINQLYHHMSNAWKIIVPIGVVAIILAAFGFYQHSYQPGGNTVQAPLEENTQAIQTGATEVADTMDTDVNSIVDGVTSEQPILDDEENDLALVDSDSQALSAFDNLNEVYGQ